MPDATFDPAAFFVEPQWLGSDSAHVEVFVPCSYELSQSGLAGADRLYADNLYDAGSKDKANHPPAMGKWTFAYMSWRNYGRPECKAMLRFEYRRGKNPPPEAEIIKFISDLLPDLTRRVGEYREAMARRCAESKAAQEKRTAEQARASLIASGVKQARQEIMRLARKRIGLDEVLSLLHTEMEAAVKDILDKPDLSRVLASDIVILMDGQTLSDPAELTALADEINAQVKGDIGKMVRLWDNPFA